MKEQTIVKEQGDVCSIEQNFCSMEHTALLAPGNSDIVTLVNL
ncbi:MAG: hypothetical protein ACR5KX_00725 [Wolbachia sp.]